MEQTLHKSLVFVKVYFIWKHQSNRDVESLIDNSKVADLYSAHRVHSEKKAFKIKMQCLLIQKLRMLKWNLLKLILKFKMIFKMPPEL